MYGRKDFMTRSSAVRGTFEKLLIILTKIQSERILSHLSMNIRSRVIGHFKAGVRTIVISSITLNEAGL